jgi:L-fuconolactonase
VQIVDAHIHFWDPAGLRYPWLTELPAIHRPFLPADLLAQVGPHELEKIVFVQAGAHPDDALAEVAWVSELARSEPRIDAIVADAPLEDGVAVAGHLAALQKYPLVKGVRRLIQAEGLGFANTPAFIQAVQLLPDYGFSFDICIVHYQLGDVLQLVAACPDVAFVLDHFGKPAIKVGGMEPWASQIAELAAFPNVHCKLSGLITEADHDAWQPADLQPYIDHVLACFGPARLMYGGDWPVSLLATDSWASWVATAEAALSGCSKAEKAAIFAGNASAFYRL